MPPTGKRIRDITRLLSRPNIDEVSRESLTREIERLKAQQDTNVRNEKEKQIAIKYHGIKFFERKKALRNILQVQKKISDASLKDKELKKLEKEKASHMTDLAYILYYPKSMKYISLFVAGDDENSEKSLKLKDSARSQAVAAWEADKIQGNDEVVRVIQVEMTGGGSGSGSGESQRSNDSNIRNNSNRNNSNRSNSGNIEKTSDIHSNKRKLDLVAGVKASSPRSGVSVNSVPEYSS